jgi:quercetin dioxygenase-like cupin family protein
MIQRGRVFYVLSEADIVNPKNHYEWEQIEKVEFFPGCTRQAIHTETMTVARIHLAQGAVVPEHRHLNEQVSVVERGRLRFRVDGRDLILEAGQALVLDPDSPHGVEALEACDVIDIFSPPREDWK